MENWLRFMGNIDSEGIKNLSKEETQKILAEKFDYISSLIKYSKKSGLKMKEYKLPEWSEWTFACGLWEEWDVSFQEFMDWKIELEDIPTEYFEPKYLYYRLPFLLTKNNDVLWPIIDHELQRAESTDFSDIVWNSREAVIHNLPVTSVGIFFNTFEDMYISKNQIRRWRAKKMWVLNLYRDMLQTSWQLDMRNSKPKLDQFSMLALYSRLNYEFPNEFKTEVIVDDDVQEEFNEFLPYLEEILDTQISNKERIQKKNEVLWPIIDRLWQKDMDALKRSKMKEQIEQEKKRQQEEQLKNTEQNTKNSLMDNLGENQDWWWESWREEWRENQDWWWESWWEEWVENQDWWWESWWEEWVENQDWWWESWWEGWVENQDWRWESWWEEWRENQDWWWESWWEEWKIDWEQWWKEVNSWTSNGKTNSRIEEEIRRRLSSMTQEEMKNFEEQIKNEIDKKNVQEHGNDLQLQKNFLGKKNDGIDDRLKDVLSTEWEKKENISVVEKQLEQDLDKSQQEIQGQSWVVVDLEQRENDLEQEKEIQEILAKIATSKMGEDFDRIEKLQNELEKLGWRVENIATEDIKERTDKAIKTVKEYINQQEQNYEKQLKKKWFSRDEEYLYKEYLEIEKEMEEYVDKFIKELEKEVPKLKEFNLEWGYSSWRIEDMNDAGKKVRLKQWWEKLYSRAEENESMKIDLGICLSVDNSWSMSEELYDTRRLAVFLWLLSEKWWIPFHINTFSEGLNVIKNVGDEFETKKWNFMRELNADGGCTNMSVSVQKNLEVIKKVKRTNPDTVFLPIFITDWAANRWITGQWLIELMKWFKWTSIVAWIWINEWYLKQRYPDSKVIWMKDSSEIMTKLLKSLKQFFVQNKSKIFKVVTQ